MSSIRVIEIVDGTSVDGPGLRTTIYFAGCSHRCYNCHNPESWDQKAGSDMDIEAIVEHIIENDFDVTFSGGDPLFQVDALFQLAERVRLLGKNIWCYTGYTYEEIVKSEQLSKILQYVDVIVDGRFVNELRDTSLRFRGSSNQRIIDVQKSLATGNIELLVDF